MKGAIIVNGRQYISASRAAGMTKYSRDYIGQLCRSGKVPATMPVRSWFIDLDALLRYKADTERALRANHLPTSDQLPENLGDQSDSAGVTVPPVVPRFVPISAQNLIPHIEWKLTYGADERPLLPTLSKGEVQSIQSRSVKSPYSSKTALVDKTSFFASHKKTVAIAAVMAVIGSSLAFAAYPDKSINTISAAAISAARSIVTADNQVRIFSEDMARLTWNDVGGVFTQVASLTSIPGKDFETAAGANSASISSWWSGARDGVIAFFRSLFSSGSGENVQVAKNSTSQTKATTSSVVYVYRPLTERTGFGQTNISNNNSTTIANNGAQSQSPFDDSALRSRITYVESGLSSLSDQLASVSSTGSGLTTSEVNTLIGLNLSNAFRGMSFGGNTTIINSGSGGAGSVTSVDASGGATGLSFTGGPVTSSGSLTLGGTLAVANGGTGTSSAPTYGKLLVGNSAGGYDLVATSTIGLGGSSGTVSSVNASGGSTGLSFSGGPIIGAGTLTLAGTLGTANGGTGLNSVGASSSVVTTDGSILKYNKLSPGYFTTSNVSQWVNDAGYLSAMAFAYPFGLSGNATSTLTQFNGGLTSFASSTIGNGTQAGGLTVSGGATTTGNAYIGGTLGIGVENTANALDVYSGASRRFSVTKNGGGTFDIGNGSGEGLNVIYSGTTVFSAQPSGLQLDNYNGFPANTYTVSTGANTTDLKFTTTGSAPLVFAPGGTEMARFTSSGYVGIGTSSPSRQLSVGDSAVFGGNVLSANFTATSSAASTFPYASTTALTASYAIFGAGLTNCIVGNKLLWSNGQFSCGIDATGGGGTGGGSWSTTTSQVVGEVVNYSNNSSDIVAIGNNSTTTAKYWFDPNTSTASLAGSVSVGGTLTANILHLNNALGLAYGGTGLTVIGASSTILQSNGTSLVYQKLSPALFTTSNVSQWVNDAGYLTSTFAYPFGLSGNATSTLTQFNGGLTAFASSTIGNGTQAGGLTVNGGATTTGNAYFAGNIGIGVAPGSTVGLRVDSSSNNYHILAHDSSSGSDVFKVGLGGNTTIYVNNNAASSPNLNLSRAGGTGDYLQVSSPLASNGDLVTISNAGNLGLGTTSPYRQLSIGNSGVFGGNVLAANFTATTSTASTFPYASTTAISATNAYATNLIISGLTGGATRCLQVNADGSVAANTSACGSGGGSGNISWSTTTSQVAGVNVNYANTASDVVTVGANSTTTAKFWLDPNTQVGYVAGKLGIGTATPGEKLDIAGGNINIASGQRYKYNNADIAFGITALADYFFGPAGNTSIMTGSNNLGFGLNALRNTTGGNSNIAIGTNALLSNTVGGSNVALGLQSLTNNDNGVANIALGENTLQLNVSGIDNTAVGYAAGNNSTSNNNLFLGALTGQNLTSGGNNIVIGYNISTPAVNSANTLNIGNLIYATGVDGAGLTPSSGSVGIGTSTPSRRFSVQGSGLFSGNLAIASLTATGTVTLSGFNPFNLPLTLNSSGILVATGTQSFSAPFFIGTSTATSTFAGPHAFTYASTTATSTMAGINLPYGGCVAVGGVCLTNNTGTVTSVSGSGGTTGLTLAGGAITTSGTLTLGGTLNIANGGTGLTSIGASSTLLQSNGTSLVYQKLSPALFTSQNVSQWTNDAGYLTSTFAYPFGLSGNATSTLTQFNGGLTAFASSTIGNGAQTGGLTVNGGATTTGSAYIAGNVGIGTTGPEQALDIEKTTAGVKVGSSDASSEAFTDYWVGSAQIGTFEAYGNSWGASSRQNALALTAQNDTNGKIIFTTLTGGTYNDRMVIANNGNIGMGTTSPYRHLSVGNSAVFGGDVTAATFTATSSTASIFPYASTTALTSSGSAYFATAGGSVGIGTTTPATKMQIDDVTANGSISYTSSGANILQIGTQGGAGQLYGGGESGRLAFRITGRNAIIGTAGANYLALGTNDTERMRIDSSGFLGIGTIAPTTNLTIGNGTAVSGQLGVSLARGATTNFFEASDNTKDFIGGVDNTLAYGKVGMLSAHDLAIVTGNSAKIYVQNSTGNVGIGTTSPLASQKLDVAGSVRTTTGLNVTGNGGFFNSANKFGIDVNGSASRFYASGPDSSTRGSYEFHVTDSVGTLDTIAAVIDPSGNVGIGTTSPYAKLSVVGPVVAEYFTAISTTATSTFAGGLNVGNGSLTYDFSSAQTSIASLNTGALSFDSDAGTVSWVDLPVVNAVAGTPESYTAQLAGNPAITVYGTSTGSGNVTSAMVGIATTTPWRTLSVNGTVSIAGLTTMTGVNGSALCLSGSGTNEVVVNTGAQTCTLSSARYKHDIASSTSGLSTVMALSPVTFYYNADTKNKDQQFGFIAEDVQNVDPRLVALDSEGKPQTVRYEELTSVLTKAIQEQQFEIDSLRSLASSTAEIAQSSGSGDSSSANVAASIQAVKDEVSALRLELSSTTATLADVASSTAATLTATPSFLQSLAGAVRDIISVAGNWVVDQLTVRIAYIDRVQANVVAVSKGIEMPDMVTGTTFCITIRNGDFYKARGSCADLPPAPEGAASSTLPIVTPDPIVITPNTTTTLPVSGGDVTATSTATSTTPVTATTTDVTTTQTQGSGTASSTPAISTPSGATTTTDTTTGQTSAGSTTTSGSVTDQTSSGATPAVLAPVVTDTTSTPTAPVDQTPTP